MDSCFATHSKRILCVLVIITSPALSDDTGGNASDSNSGQEPLESESLAAIDRQYQRAHSAFESECRDFITRTATDQSLVPEERMAAIEQWFAAQADRIESLNQLADYLDEHAPLPPRKPYPERPLSDDPRVRLVAELRNLAIRFDGGAIPLEVYDKARFETVARQQLPEEGEKSGAARAVPVVSDTGDPSLDYVAHARRLAALPTSEAAAQIDNPLSPYNQSLRRLEASLEEEFTPQENSPSQK